MFFRAGHFLSFTHDLGVDNVNEGTQDNDEIEYVPSVTKVVLKEVWDVRETI